MKLLVDVHTHLDNERFHEDLDKVVENAVNAGIKVMITNGLDISSNRKVLAIAEKFNKKLGKSIIKVALGIYPIDCLKLSEEEIDAEIEFIKSQRKKIVAIGEIGIDYHWDKTEEGHEKQKKAFIKFVRLAKKLDIPVIVHSRDAEEDAIDILEKEACKKVDMHCFGGSLELVKRIEKNKWFMSIPANLVISGHFQKIVKNMDLGLLLTETDAPYLGPEKGKRNEPANVALTIKKIADIKGMTQEDVENNIFMNYQRLFG